MKTQWSVCQRFPSCSVSPPPATHPLATSGDVVVCSVALPGCELTVAFICFFIVADSLVGWSFDSSGLHGHAPVPLTAASLLPCLALRHGGGGFACITQKPLLLSVGTCCSSPLSGLQPAPRTPHLFLFPFPLYSSPPLHLLLPRRVALFFGYFQPIARPGSPAAPRTAPNQHQQRDQAARPHGSASD